MFANYNFLGFSALVFFGIALGATAILISVLKGDNEIKRGAEFVPIYFFAAAAVAKYFS